MNKIILPDEVQKEVDTAGSNVVPFEQPPRLATGGGPPVGDNWLRKLGENCVFFARPTGTQPLILTEYHVIAHHEKATTLFVRDPGGQNDVYLNVDPIVFSVKIELFEIIKDGDPI